jgi:antitoxin VapB
MARTIDHPLADELAHQLAEITGEPVEDAIVTAIQQRLRRESGRDVETSMRRIEKIQEHFVAHMIDSHTADEIIGYDEDGLPK